MPVTKSPRMSSHVCVLIAEFQNSQLISLFSHPAGDKSLAQQASDSTSNALGGKPGEKPLIEQVQDAATDAFNTVSKAATGMSFASIPPGTTKLLTLSRYLQ